MEFLSLWFSFLGVSKRTMQLLSSFVFCLNSLKQEQGERRAMESAVTSCGRNTPPWPTDIHLGHRISFGQHHVWPMPHPSRSFKSHGLSCSFSSDVKMTFHACWVASVVSNSTVMDCSFPGSSVHGILQGWNWSGLSCPHQGIFPTQGTDLCLFCLLN